MTVAGGLVLALVGLSRWSRRLESGRGASQRGRCQRRIALTQQHALHLVEIEGRRLLVGTGPGEGPRLLGELEARSEGASATEGTSMTERTTMMKDEQVGRGWDELRARLSALGRPRG